MKKTLIIATAAGLAMSTGVEAQDDELFMNSIKNGYYTVSNAVLSRPAMIAGGMQMVQNGMARPTFLNHFDEVADNNLAVEDAQDDELFMNSIKNGYYTVSNAILSRPAMIAGGMQMVQNGMARPTFLNHFDEEVADNNLAFADEVADNNLIWNSVKNGYYTATNWALANPDKIYAAGNFGANMLMNPKWDDELNAVEQAQKTETKKPKEPRRRQRLERPDDYIKRNTKFRVSKEHVADNTLFDLADMIQDN